MKIVTLLPSATEIVCSIGLRKSLVAVSHECDFPNDVVSLPRITSSIIPDNLSTNQTLLLLRVFVMFVPLMLAP